MGSNATCIIRLATVDFIKETLVALPAAPSADEFGRLRAERVRAAERRVAEEREAARLAKAKFEEHRAQQASGIEKYQMYFKISCKTNYRLTLIIPISHISM